MRLCTTPNKTGATYEGCFTESQNLIAAVNVARRLLQGIYISGSFYFIQYYTFGKRFKPLAYKGDT